MVVKGAVHKEVSIMSLFTKLCVNFKFLAINVFTYKLTNSLPLTHTDTHTRLSL